jgi:hypothetical protein
MLPTYTSLLFLVCRCCDGGVDVLMLWLRKTDDGSMPLPLAKSGRDGDCGTFPSYGGRAPLTRSGLRGKRGIPGVAGGLSDGGSIAMFIVLIQMRLWKNYFLGDGLKRSVG